MTSRISSFAGIFTEAGPTRPIKKIEIPLWQRDYAQGRPDDKAKSVRLNFVKDLHSAVTGGDPISLDFVYGEIDESGTLRPLDGQQRLTTLFLLHWYLASHTDHLDHPCLRQRFSYATRTSARMFCERLVESVLPDTDQTPSAWIKNQFWYLHVWRHDPTIQSMLEMLDTIHRRFAEADLDSAWNRLTDPDSPAVNFHLLSIAEMGSAQGLYIKMNSRGKPLTDFENFKAGFQALIEKSLPKDTTETFATKVDGAWSDTLWSYRGDDDIIDDEFLRYFQYITELCEWREGRLSSPSFEQATEACFGPENPKAHENLTFLSSCFDTWEGMDITEALDPYFTTSSESPEGSEGQSVLVFDSVSNLLAACLDGSGASGRQFTAAQGLLLYGVLLHRIHKTPKVNRRLRILRNLVAASEDEIRAGNMPKLVRDVQRIIVDGVLDDVEAFNRNQVKDEKEKSEFLTEHPELKSAIFALEDHRLLRGSLMSFELDPAAFRDRATAFATLMSTSEHWQALTGALLTVGDYSRRRGSQIFRFGSPTADRWWRELLTGASRMDLERTASVLAAVLDRIGASTSDPAAELERIQEEWLTQRQTQEEFDWRYYFVRYPAMRHGKSGMYATEDGHLGYSTCMLDKTQMNSLYRDAYLYALAEASGSHDAIENHWFRGYAQNPRWMRLKASGTMVRCVTGGFELKPPSNAEARDAFDTVCAEHEVGEDLILTITQKQSGDSLVDTQDRIQAGAALLKALVDAGL